MSCTIHIPEQTNVLKILWKYDARLMALFTTCKCIYPDSFCRIRTAGSISENIPVATRWFDNTNSFYFTLQWMKSLAMYQKPTILHSMVNQRSSGQNETSNYNSY